MTPNQTGGPNPHRNNPNQHRHTPGNRFDDNKKFTVNIIKAISDLEAVRSYSGDNIDELAKKILDILEHDNGNTLIEAIKKTYNTPSGLPLEHIGLVTLTLDQIDELYTKTGFDTKSSPAEQKILALTFLDRFETYIHRTYGNNPEAKTIFTQEVLQHKDQIQTIKDLQYYIRQLETAYATKNISLSYQEVYKKLSIRPDNIGKTLVAEGTISKAELDAVVAKKTIPTGSVLENNLKHFFHVYGVSALKHKLELNIKAVERFAAASSFSGIWGKIMSYDLDATNVEDVTDRMGTDDIENAKLQIAARVKGITQKDPVFGKVLEELVNTDFNFSKLSPESQKLYLQELKSSWLASDAGKAFKEFLELQEFPAEHHDDIIHSVFSLEDTPINLVYKDTEKQPVTLQLKKKLSDSARSARTNDQFQSGLPIVFTLSSPDNSFTTSSPTELIEQIVLVRDANSMTKEDEQAVEQETTKKNIDDVTQKERTGIDEASRVNTVFLDNIDREDEEEVRNALQSMSSDEMTNASRIYEKKGRDTTKDINSKKAKITLLTNEINNLGRNQRHGKLSDEEVQKREIQKQRLVDQIADIEGEKAELEKNAVQYNQRAKELKQLAKQKKKQEDEQNRKGEDHNPEAKKNRKDEPKEEKNPRQEMEDAWNKLQGDTRAKFEKGSAFFVELEDAHSVVPGWKHPWAKATITELNEDGTFTVQWSGVEGTLENAEGKTTQFFEGGFEELKNRPGVGKILKFPPTHATSWKDWGTELKLQTLSFDKEHKDYLTNLLGKVDFGSWYRKQPDQKIKEESGNAIRYIGGSLEDMTEKKDGEKKEGEAAEKEIKNQPLWFEVTKQTSNTVTIQGKDKNGNSYTKTMDTDSFMVFMMDKGLTTYTQNEVDDINKGRGVEPGANTIFNEIDRSQDLPGKTKRIKWTNITSILHCKKKIVEGIKAKFKKNQEKENTALEELMLDSDWFKSLGNLKPKILGDAFKDMIENRDDKKDRELMKKVEEAMKEPEEKGENTADGPWEYIKKKVFDKVTKGDYSATQEKPEKTLGYYLYLLSKGNPYPKKLAEHADKGIWVGALLGEAYQKQYLTRYADLKHKVVQNTATEADIQKLAGGEVEFLKMIYATADEKKTNFKKVLDSKYSRKFVSLLGKYGGERYDTSKIDEAQKTAKAKVFGENKGDMKSAFGQLNMNNMIANLESMGDKIKGSRHAYSQWMMSLAMPILGGLTLSDMNGDYKKRISDLGMKFAAPYGLFAKEPDGQKKLWELFTVVSELSGIEPSFEKTFKEFSPVPSRDKLEKFYKTMDAWRYEQGSRMLPLLTKPGKILQKIAELEKKIEDNQGDKQQNVNTIKLLKEYFEKKCMSDEKKGVGDIDGGSVAYEEHIMILTPGFVNEHMLDYRFGTFNGKKNEYSGKLWKALGKEIKSYSEKGQEVSPETYQLVLKQFVNYFDKFQYSYNNSLQTAIKYNDSPDLMRVAITNTFDPQGNALPPEVKDTLAVFEKFFLNHSFSKQQMADVFKYAFGKDKGTVEYITSLDPNGVRKQGKNEVEQFRKDAIKEAMKKHGINISEKEKWFIIKDRWERGYIDAKTGEEVKMEKTQGKKGKGGGEQKWKGTKMNGKTDMFTHFDPETVMSYYDYFNKQTVSTTDEEDYDLAAA